MRYGGVHTHWQSINRAKNAPNGIPGGPGSLLGKTIFDQFGLIPTAGPTLQTCCAIYFLLLSGTFTHKRKGRKIRNSGGAQAQPAQDPSRDVRLLENKCSKFIDV